MRLTCKNCGESFNTTYIGDEKGSFQENMKHMIQHITKKHLKELREVQKGVLEASTMIDGLLSFEKLIDWEDSPNIEKDMRLYSTRLMEMAIRFDERFNKVKEVIIQ